MGCDRRRWCRPVDEPPQLTPAEEREITMTERAFALILGAILKAEPEVSVERAWAAAERVAQRARRGRR